MTQRIPVQRSALAGRVDDVDQLAIGVVSVTGDIPQGIGELGAVAALVVAVVPAAAGPVGFNQGQRPMLEKYRRVAAPERVLRGTQVAGVVVAVLPLPALGIDGVQQLALIVPLKPPAVAEVVGVVGDLVLGVPAPGADTAQAVGDHGGPGVQVVVEAVGIALVGPVLDHPPFTALDQRPLIKAAQPAGQPVLDHALLVVDELPPGLAQRIRHFRQIAMSVVVVTGQHFAAVVDVEAFQVADPPWPLRRIHHPQAHDVEGVAHMDQTPGFVVIEKDAVVVAIPQLRQAQGLGVGSNRLKQPITPVLALDQQRAVVMSAHRQAFTGAVHRAARRNPAHVDGPRLLVGIDQSFAALGVRLNAHADFKSDAPARPEHPVGPGIAAVVKALPGHRENAGDKHVKFLGIAQDLGACRRMHRVRRGAHGPVQRADGLAGGKAVDAAERHARQVADKGAPAAAQQHQGADRHAHARRLAAAHLTHHHRGAADDHVGRNASGRDHRCATTAAITAAHGGLAVDEHRGRAFGQ